MIIEVCSLLHIQFKVVLFDLCTVSELEMKNGRSRNDCLSSEESKQYVITLSARVRSLNIKLTQQ